MLNSAEPEIFPARKCFGIREGWIGRRTLVGWLVVLCLTALRESISVCIGPSPKERDKEEIKDR